MNESPETRLSLIGRLQNQDDSDAWYEFVQLYQPLILTIVQRRGLQYADATEVTQEVLGRVARSIENWDPDPQHGSFRGWLYRMTRNLTIDFLRRDGSSLVVTDDGEMDIRQIPHPSEEDSQEFRMEYERRLFHWAASQVRASFKVQNWNAFWLSAVEGHSIQKVAEQLGLSHSAVYVARSRVMARIAAEISQRMEETKEVGLESNE